MSLKAQIDRAAEVCAIRRGEVSDEMVDRALNAFFGERGWSDQPITAMRRALEAALSPLATPRTQRRSDDGTS